MYKNIHKLSKLLIAITIVVISFLASAQECIPVTGLVITAENNAPLEGVTIASREKGFASVTNSEGRFVIVLPPSLTSTDSLTFSYIGYKPAWISIADAVKNKSLTIKLSVNVENLKEVVIKPLSLKQLLDSISHHNSQTFVSPMKLNGYYREFVYTDTKCTEYSDALCEYYADHRVKADGQLKINASRCIKDTKPDRTGVNKEVFVESQVNPNIAFNHAMFSAMITKYFPDKSLPDYTYILEQSDQPNSDIRVTIYARPVSTDAFYKLTLNLNSEMTLKEYRLEIPDNQLKLIKAKSFLGIHVLLTGLLTDVKYIQVKNGIYPNYYSIRRNLKVWGGMLGTKVNEDMVYKSEFLTSEISSEANIKPFERNEIYKKGNICNNGAAINNALLRNYTIIVPSAKDNEDIKDLAN